MVERRELTYGESVDFLDVKFIAGSTTSYTTQPRIFKFSDINLMLKA